MKNLSTTPLKFFPKMVLENGKDEFYTYIQILELKSFFTVLFL
jgi:hypothetical protein